MNFKIGKLISAYDEEGLPCSGTISSFDGEHPEFGPMAIIRLFRKDHKGEAVYERVRLNTAHVFEKKYVTHTKETFLAAVSRSSPCLYFKDDKARRDFAASLWEELSDFSLRKDEIAE